VEVLSVLLYVRTDRNEVFVDKRGDIAVGIGFGLQPDTTASTRRSAEIEQERLAPLPGVGKSRIDIFLPLNRHSMPPFTRKLMIDKLSYKKLPRAKNAKSTLLCEKSLRRLKLREMTRNFTAEDAEVAEKARGKRRAHSPWPIASCPISILYPYLTMFVL
jgi:hypothetical protein